VALENECVEGYKARLKYSCFDKAYGASLAKLVHKTVVVLYESILLSVL